MTIDELIADLISRQALIVHCSRQGKGDEMDPTKLYPNDLHTATKVCGQGKALSCSVIWPSHSHTFGQIGIVLVPKSIASVTSVNESDSGSYVDANGERVGLGEDLSRESLERTFSHSQSYNEWTICDAVTVGIYVDNPNPVVSRIFSSASFPGLPPEYAPQGINAGVKISRLEVVADFPDLPIYALGADSILKLNVASDAFEPVSAATIY
jgi:hypothetical protein